MKQDTQVGVDLPAVQPMDRQQVECPQKQIGRDEITQAVTGGMAQQPGNAPCRPIGGTPINLLQMPEGCAFCPRCESAMKICLKQQPAEFRVGEDHLASCWMNVKEIYEAQEGGSNEQ